MNWNEFTENVLKRETADKDSICSRIEKGQMPLVSCFSYIISCSKLVDALKKRIFYGKNIDIKKIDEDTGKIRDKESYLISNSYGSLDNFTLKSKEQFRTIHSIFGMQTEVSELAEQVFCSLSGDKEIDVVNIKEEIGDLFWYIAIICDVFNLKFEDILISNVEKLTKRYGEKFTEEKAINRNLEEERKILEK